METVEVCFGGVCAFRCPPQMICYCQPRPQQVPAPSSCTLSSGNTKWGAHSDGKPGFHRSNVISPTGTSHKPRRLRQTKAQGKRKRLAVSFCAHPQPFRESFPKHNESAPTRSRTHSSACGTYRMLQAPSGVAEPCLSANACARGLQEAWCSFRCHCSRLPVGSWSGGGF